MLKFVGGPLSGLALGLSWVETSVCTVSGMMMSVILVTYTGKLLQTLWRRFKPATPKRFTRRTRLAVRIWKRSGMIGIAFLTPILLTPIGGTILAVSFRVNRGLIFSYMLMSAAWWSVIITLATYQLSGFIGK
ncbi:hypothetical protein [Tellurirhabdus bombi]|uniref:hypothetical protein n=1 Tax=Tellurirhabdus bombi TaxID=2907205 RepID=UPI00286DACAF|nr:hypothetical protein [Tellurirhabdus bombi]